MNPAKKYTLAFAILWIFTFIIYPSWLLPETYSSRLLMFIALLIIVFIAIKLFYKWANKNIKEDETRTKKERFSFKKIIKDKYHIILLLFLIISIIVINP